MSKAGPELPRAKATPGAEPTVALKSQAAPAGPTPVKASANHTPGGVREELEELEQQGTIAHFLRGLFKSSPAWLTSMLVHLVALLLLALLLVPTQPAQIISDLIANTVDEKAEEI